MRLYLLLTLIGIYLLPAKLDAVEEDPSPVLSDEVTVQAEVFKSIAVPDAASAEALLDRIAGGTSLIRSENYKRGKVSNLQDVLGWAPGVFIQSRFGSEEARLSIRGSGLQRTFHLRGIKLLQDGVPMNQADGGGDFQAIEPLALQYVEVYRGANALRYGGNTLGGAVNFVSPTGYDARLVQGRLEVGGYNYLREQVSSGGVGGPLDYFVSLSEFRQDGFRNHSDQWTRRVYSNYGWRITEEMETRFYLNLVDSKSKLPGALTQAQMRQNPKQNAPANVIGNQKRDFDLIHLANKTVIQGDGQRLELGVFWIRKDLFHPVFQVLDVLTHDIGGGIRYLQEHEIFSRRNRLTFGFNPVFGTAADLRSLNTGGARGARTAESRQRSINLDFYGEDQFYFFDRLALTAGLQWSFASRKTLDRFLSDGNHSGHPQYHGLSPKAGILYELSETHQVFANFSRSFEPPSFGELNNVTGGGIRDLTEQKAETLEIGTRGASKKFSWDFAYYYAWVENELLSLNDAFGNPLGTVNAYQTLHQGVEFGGSLRLFENWLTEPQSGNPDTLILQTLYNWSRFRFENDPVFSDNPLPGIPEHFVRAELLYEHPSGIYFGPHLETSLKKYPVDMNNTLFADPYVLLGLKGGWRMKSGWHVFIEARNLTNQVYAATTGVVADVRGQDSAQFFPGDGRTVIGGVEVAWG